MLYYNIRDCEVLIEKTRQSAFWRDNTISAFLKDKLSRIDYANAFKDDGGVQAPAKRRKK